MAVVAPVSGPPTSGLPYPRTLSEFNEWFSDEESCYAYLERLRWPQGTPCTKCGVIGRVWHVSPRKLRCLDCRHQMSITAGTIFERTHLPLRAWFQAAWLMTNEKLGISALGVKRSLELKRYETTWLVLHKLRRAMVDPDRELLGGEVEVDESYLGSPEPGSPGRKLLGKTIVAIAVEILPEGANDGQRAPSGRVRIARIEDTSSSSLIGFVSSNVDEGSVIYTDYWRGYLGLEKAGFIHHRTNVSATGSPAHVSLPRVHRVASLLRRWILGTHQGGVRQIEPYLEEFVFRFNRRRSTCRGLLFYRLLQLAVKIDPVTAREIIFSPTVPSTDKDVPF